MRSYIIKRSVVLLALCLPLISLQAGGQKKAILSADGSDIYAKYSTLMDKVSATSAWLQPLLDNEGTTLEKVRGFLLLLEQPGVAQSKDLSPWQKKFIEITKRQSQQMEAAYQELLTQAKSLSDSNESAYLQALIGYALFNTVESLLPDSGSDKQKLAELVSLIKPVVLAKKYQLSDLYRLYADLLSRSIVYAPAEVISLSSDSKRYVEQAIKLDSSNGSAYISLGTWYIYAPAAGGGDDEYALKLFKQARGLGLGTLDELMSWNMTALAYDHLRQPEKVAESLEKALDISALFQMSLNYRQRLKAGKPLEDFYYE